MHVASYSIFSLISVRADGGTAGDDHYYYVLAATAAMALVLGPWSMVRHGLRLDAVSMRLACMRLAADGGQETDR